MRILLITIFLLLVVVVSSHAQQAKVQRKGSMKRPFIFNQQFKHSFGAGATFYEIDKSNEPVFSLQWNPSLSLTKSFSDFSVSIGGQPAAGYHFAGPVDDSSFFFTDIPVFAELNFGHNASKDFYSDMGWFIGGGYSYHLFRDAWSHGPVATIGARGFVFGPSFTVRYMRFFALRDEDASLQTISLLLNMGRYFEQVKLNNKVSRFSDRFRK